MSDQTAFRIRQESAARYLALKMHQRRERMARINSFIGWITGSLLTASLATTYLFSFMGV
jgi:hypothetical protein